MTINISIPDVGPNLHPQITVLGVGGSGGNAVNNMMSSNLEGVDFVIANTDAQALQISSCQKKIQLGIKSTRGLGAGMRPDIGKQAAEETIKEISEMLEGSHMLFIAAGMGGGTGTGAAPVIAKLAREKGILTVGVVTKPFHFEGSQRMKLANKGLEELQQYVDTLLTIPNQNLFRIANEKTTFADAFKMADDILYAGVRGVTDLMVQPGLINLDFSDVKTVMSEMGKAMMGTGEASGEGRAIAAAEAAIANPLIDDVSLKGAKGLIINISGGNDITLYEVDEAANRIKQEVDEEANIIYGTTCDDRLEGTVRVSIVATGIDVNTSFSAKPLEKASTLSIDNSVYLQQSLNSFTVNSPDEKNEYQPTENNKEIIKDDDYKDSDIKNNNLLSNIESSEENHSSLNYDLSERDILDQTSTINSDESDNKKNEVQEFTSEPMIETSDDEPMIETSDDEPMIETSDDEPMIETSDDEPMIETSDSVTLDENQSRPSVRRLSLFDNLEDENLKVKSSEQIMPSKSEPVFHEDVNNDIQIQNNDDIKDKELSPEESESDNEYNQETEEELLDIPTFLRRQAN